MDKSLFYTLMLVYVMVNIFAKIKTGRFFINVKDLLLLSFMVFLYKYASLIYSIPHSSLEDVKAFFSYFIFVAAGVLYVLKKIEIFGLMAVFVVYDVYIANEISNMLSRMFDNRYLFLIAFVSLLYLMAAFFVFSFSNKFYTNRSSKNSFAKSMLLGFLFNSTLLGYFLGGSMFGAMLGDMLVDDCGSGSCSQSSGDDMLNYTENDSFNSYNNSSGGTYDSNDYSYGNSDTDSGFGGFGFFGDSDDECCGLFGSGGSDSDWDWD